MIEKWKIPYFLALAIVTVGVSGTLVWHGITQSYTNGYTAGKTAGYASGYDAGVKQIAGRFYHDGYSAGVYDGNQQALANLFTWMQQHCSTVDGYTSFHITHTGDTYQPVCTPIGRG